MAELAEEKKWRAHEQRNAGTEAASLRDEVDRLEREVAEARQSHAQDKRNLGMQLATEGAHKANEGAISKFRNRSK